MHEGKRHAILFVTPFDADTRMVNRFTGRHGYGHVALFSGIYEGDTAIVLDSSMTEGCVGFRPLLDMTRGVPYHSMWIDDQLGNFMLKRAMRCLGSPYDFGGLFRARARDDAFTCSGLIRCALPQHLVEQCRPTGRFGFSPNDLARGLGVPRWGAT